MPMYKKSLIALVLIIGVISAVIFYNQSSEDAIADEMTTTKVATTSPSQQHIAVYVTGEVAKPGVIILKDNNRVADAILACGDFTPSADKQKINLAEKVKDGQQITVPAKVQNSSSPNQPTNNSQGNNQQLININTANAQELTKLPGIGSTMAERIVEYRSTNGNFNNLDDLKKIKGIGKNKFEKIQDKITL